MSAPDAILVMGVSAAGKTRVGRALAQRLGWMFIDADDHHPPANIAKMHAGRPLDDADRAGWLARLAALLAEHRAHGPRAVLACSALKRAYRRRLAHACALAVVHLHIDRATAAARATARSDHFFDPQLIDSQFADLEPPEPAENALVFDATQPVDALVERILRAFERPPGEA